MRKIVSLTKVMLKNLYGAQFNDKQELTKKKKFLRIFGMIALSIYLVGITFFMTRSTIESLVAINQESMLIFSSLTGLSLFLFVTLTISIPTVLYFSQDTESLLPLPLSPREILVAKITTIYVTGLSSLAFFYIPMGINYFWQVDRSVLFLLKYLFVGLFIPVVPTVIASLIIVLLFSFIPKVNNKDLFTYVSSIFVFVIIFYSGFTSGSTMDSGGLVGSIINSDGPLINKVNSFVPTIPMFARFITQNNIIQGLLAIVITLVVAFLALFIMEQLYFKGLLASNEETKKEKQLNKKQMEKRYQQKGILASLIHADFQNIFRTPVLAINYLLVLIILPLSFALPTVLIIKETGWDKVSELLLEFNQLLNSVGSEYIVAGTIVITLAISYFISSMTTIASTSFSREGENMMNYQIMPLTLMDLVHAKLMVANIVSMVPGLLISFIAITLLKLPAYLYLVALITVLLAVNLTTLEGLLIDTLAPKLVWEDITQALKQNFMATIPIFSSFLIMGLAGFALYKFTKPLTVYLIVLIMIIIQVLIYQYIKKKAIYKLEKAIEAL
ncbi:MAG TPA: hypothetical protein VIG45_00165 [Erysipelothrix sp.]